MPSMGVGTSDADRPAHTDPDDDAYVAPTRSPPLTQAEGTVALQHWVRRQQSGQRSRCLLSLLAFLCANGVRSKAAMGSGMPSACEGLTLNWASLDPTAPPHSAQRERALAQVMCCLLDCAETYTAAVDGENYTRLLLCDETLPATNAAWRTASPAARRLLRQRHPLLRRLAFLPEAEKLPLLRQLQQQLEDDADVIAETAEQTDSEDVASAWTEVEMRMTMLFGTPLTAWLAQALRVAPESRSANNQSVPLAAQAVASWLAWRGAGGGVGGGAVHTLPEEDQAGQGPALVEDIPPLPPPRPLSVTSPSASAAVTTTDKVDTVSPLPLQSSGTTTSAPGTGTEADTLDVDLLLRDEAYGNGLRPARPDDEEAVLRTCNTRFFAQQEKREATLRHSLEARLGIETSDAATATATDADAHAGATVETGFGNDVRLVVAPFLGCAHAGDAGGDCVAAAASCVCTLCELDGVWPGPSQAGLAEVDDALTKCAVCHAVVHVDCARRVAEGALVCSSLCVSHYAANKV